MDKDKFSGVDWKIVVIGILVLSNIYCVSTINSLQKEIKSIYASVYFFEEGFSKVNRKIDELSSMISDNESRISSVESRVDDLEWENIWK